jgi:hypothetical protein
MNSHLIDLFERCRAQGFQVALNAPSLDRIEFHDSTPDLTLGLSVQGEAVENVRWALMLWQPGMQTMWLECFEDRTALEDALTRPFDEMAPFEMNLIPLLALDLETGDRHRLEATYTLDLVGPYSNGMAVDGFTDGGNRTVC